MFIEVLVLDAFNKTPTVLDPLDQYNYNYYLMMEIKDPAGSSIKKDYNYVRNTTAVFTFKIGEDVSGGEYTIKVSSTSQVTPATKLVRIRDYPRDSINVKVDLPLESYRPGDTVTGSIKAELPDGSLFESEPSFEMSANFDVKSENSTSAESVSLPSQKLSLLGEGTFTFVIPNTTTSLLSTLAFLVTYEET